mgnify:CR=1 FL=1
MGEEKTPKTENFDADSYRVIAQRMSGLRKAYGGMPINDVFGAFERSGGGNMLLNWPTVQNARVKAINTRPANFSKDQIENMVIAPEGNEKSLRSVSSALAYSTQTYELILRTYADIMSYFWYIYPSYTPNKPDKAQMLREYSLAYKIAEKLDLCSKMHEILGKCMEFGKVFYTPRISVDKSHNKVNYAFLQQLPEDWCKITGFNDGPGKYTVAFNMMYFMRPGTSPAQYGDLFTPYLPAFEQVVTTKAKYVYSAEHPAIDIDKFKALGISQSAGSPQWAEIGTEWFYWVTLPADAVITFETTDRHPLVIPSATGMFVSLTQIPNYEAAQMEIVLNPLTSVLTGSLETNDTKAITTNQDPIRVSPSVREMFEALWYNMMEQNNTSGIGVYLAPAKDLKLQTISDSVANTNITSTALSDQILKAGLPALIPTTNDPKVGVAQLSAKVAAQYGETVYRCAERMMNWILEELNFKTPLRFKMFGNIFDQEADMESARKGMTLGLLIDTLRYDAMMGHSILEDMAISKFIDDSGVLDTRIPLVSSYSAKQGESGLPPQAKKDISEDGRPPEDGSINSETQEKLNSVIERLNSLFGR